MESKELLPKKPPRRAHPQEDADEFRRRVVVRGLTREEP
jgi:hypothetical protein